MYRSTISCLASYLLFITVLSSAAPNDSCVVVFPEAEKEKQNFQTLQSKGVTAIYLNFRDANGKTIQFEKKWTQEKWLWIRNEYRTYLTYTEDVDVFSFGLLGINVSAINILANVSSEENCTQNYRIHFLNHTRTITMTDSTEGSVCHSIIESSYWKNFLSNFSAVSIGYDFLCFNKGDISLSELIHKSSISYVIIAIVILVYLFFPMVMHFSAPQEEVKNAIRNYYVSDSPYSPKRCLLNFFFQGGTQCASVIRILLVLVILTIASYIFTWLVYMNCNCALMSSNVFIHFQHLTYLKDSFKTEETFVWNMPGDTVKYMYAELFGYLHFLTIYLSMLLNVNGTYDDFLVIDFSNLFKRGSFFRAIPMSVFFRKGYFKNKHQSYYKMSKFSLILSYKFWCKILLIKRFYPESIVKRVILFVMTLIQFPLNVALVMLSTFCPTVSTLYFFVLKFMPCMLLKYSCLICRNVRKDFLRSLNPFFSFDDEFAEEESEVEVQCYECCLGSMKGKYLRGETYTNIGSDDSCYRHQCAKKARADSVWLRFFEFFAHLFAMAYIVLTYIYGADIILHSMSYLLQFLLVTVFIAIPHLTFHKLTYIIFITSLAGYLGRHIFYFLQLYKNLLKDILELTKRNMIRVKDFERIVDDFFPLRNELFSLLVKLLLTTLFFVIAFDTMSKVGYLDFEGKLPDISTFITLLFMFGPPRLVEFFFVKSYTSRVYMKRDEILKYISTDKFRPTINDKKYKDKVCPNPKIWRSILHASSLKSRLCFPYVIIYTTFYSIVKRKSYIDKMENKTTFLCDNKENISTETDTDNKTDEESCSDVCPCPSNCIYRLCFACCDCPIDSRTGECTLCVSFSEEVEESFDVNTSLFLAKYDIVNEYTKFKIPGLGKKKSRRRTKRTVSPSPIEMQRL